MQSSESQLQEFRKVHARFTGAWQKLLDAASAPRKEREKARREYLDARAALENEHGAHTVKSALARCMREDRKRRGLPSDGYRNDDWAEDDEDDDGIGAGNFYWRREREDADEAERAVESSMLPGERFDRIIAGIFEGVGTLLHGLLSVAAAIFLLWALVWLVKTLWYLS